MKKVWIVALNRWNSAISEYALSLSKAFQLQSIPVTLTCLRDKPLFHRASKAGLDIRPLSGSKLVRFYLLNDLFDKLDPQVIIACGGEEETAFLFRKRCPIIRFRGDYPQKKRSPYLSRFTPSKEIWYPSPQLYEAFHGYPPSQSSREPLPQLSNALTKPPLVELTKKGRVLPLGLDTATYFREPSLMAPEKPKEILLVGRLDPIKGHRAFFKVWKKVAPLFSEKVVLHVIGEAANISPNELRAWASEEGLIEGKNVLFSFKRVTQLRSLLSSGLLGVVPSLGSELICRVAGEMLLCGLPILVQQTGSLPDMIRHPEDGAVCQDKDWVPTLSYWIQKALYEDDVTRTERTIRARASFSLETMGEEAIRLLRQGLLPDFPNRT